MRERTTWSRDQIKQAASKTADPYLMNQDHVSKQPPADKYLTGDPSTFAEDIHPAKDTWEVEYANGQVKRDEIGMPEMRKDTFNHPEKTAAEKAVLIKKANVAIRVATMMLGKTATQEAIEDQSVSLMHLPDAELVNTYNRLANDGTEMPVESQQQEMAPQAQEQAPMQQQAEMQQQAFSYQQAMDQCKQAIQAGDDDQVKQAIEAMVQAQMQQQGQQQAPMDVQAMVTKTVKKALQDMQQQGQQQTQQQQAQQQAQQQGQQAQQQQQQMAPAAVQQAPMQQQADDMLLDDMLMDSPEGMSEMDIEMDAPSMDMSDAGLGAEDEVLKTLFANDDGQQEQAQGQQEQQKQAHATRTAAARTVGTRPSQGVSRVGGGAAAPKGGESDKLSSLWASAPDVKDAFNM